MKALRPAHPEILAWDSQANEAACLAQLLYVNGKLEWPFGTSMFDRQLERLPNRPDLQRRCLHRLMSEGFEALMISPVNSHRVIESQDYLGEMWLELGCTQDEVDRYLDGAYPEVKQMYLCGLAVQREFPSQITELERKASWSDVTTLVSQGYQVMCAVYHKGGFVTSVLVVRSLGDGQYEVFSPTRGVYEVCGELELGLVMVPAIEAYRLPE